MSALEATIALILTRLTIALADELAFDEACDDYHYGSGVSDEVLAVAWGQVHHVEWHGNVIWPTGTNVERGRHPFLSGMTTRTYKADVERAIADAKRRHPSYVG
jgi:hypothetical protein